jgi:hypothetical protein
MSSTHSPLLSEAALVWRSQGWNVNVNVNVNSIGKERAWPKGADRTESSDDFAGRFQSRFGVTWSRAMFIVEPRFGKN